MIRSRETHYLATTLLNTTSQLLPLINEFKVVISNILEHLSTDILAGEDDTGDPKENKITIATVGTLIAALSYHYSLYKEIESKEDKLSPYLWNKNGEKSAYYPKQYKEVLAISGMDEPTESDKSSKQELNKYYKRLVINVGTKVMKGELHFQPEILGEIYDRHAKYKYDEYDGYDESGLFHINTNSAALKQDLLIKIEELKKYLRDISAKINKETHYEIIPSILTEDASCEEYKIEDIFNRAWNMAAKANDTPERKNFMEGVVALKKATLDRFTNLGFDNCETIAKSVLTLATQVGSNTVTQNDVDKFTKDTQKYKTSHALAIVLNVIIGAVIGMIVGAAAVGFAVGSVPGAIIGGVAGLVVGSGIACISSTMWYTKKEPLNKISSAAIDMVPNQNCK